MRWWHIDPLLMLERELFGAEAWTAGAYWSELAEAETRDYTVAVDGAAILGYAGVCTYGEEAWVQTIGVTGAAQGAGIGTALLRLMLGQARERGADQVLLEVRSDNARAQQLYDRHDFAVVGRRKGYYQPSGVDALVMRRG